VMTYHHFISCLIKFATNKLLSLTIKSNLSVVIIDFNFNLPWIIRSLSTISLSAESKLYVLPNNPIFQIVHS